jgi:diguanylate cyclase (GGDEF)-like protein
VDELRADESESERLATLHALNILDTAPERIYDDVVALAAQICDMPIAIINFVDADRQWGKALIGLESSEAPREASFCARTIQQDGGVLIVPNTNADPVWADNPQVTGAPGLHFYAGAAIVTDDGYALGSVCVADNRTPRELDSGQIEALRVLARQTASHLKLRRQAADLAHANRQLHELAIKDPLTGLPNRAFFLEALSLELRRRHKRHAGLLFCDLDGFKQVNDRYGHHVGDELLQVTAQRMNECAREGDLVARLAGDDCRTGNGDGQAASDRIEVGVVIDFRTQDDELIAGVEIAPQMSIGAALAQPDEFPAALLRRSDVAMYRIKTATDQVLHA